MYTISTWIRRSKKSNNDNDSLSIYRWVFVLLFNTFGCTKKKKKNQHSQTRICVNHRARCPSKLKLPIQGLPIPNIIPIRHIIISYDYEL